MAEKKAAKTKMPLGSALAYTVGYAGTNVSWYMINSYLNIFYTDVLLLTAEAVSIIMLIARVWDAINDPMMGAIIDRTHSRWGKFKPYIVIAPPFLTIFNILTFTVFPLEGVTKIVVCLLCYIGCGMSYTVVQVAVNGLVNRLTRDSQTKMDIISMSQIGSTLIQTALGAAVPLICLAFSQTVIEVSGEMKADAHGYFMATVIVSLISIPMFWICAWKTKEIKEEAETVAAEAVAKADKPKKEPLLKSIKALGKNNQLIIGIFCVFVGATGVMARMGLLTYYVVYAAGFEFPSGFALLSMVFPTITFSQMVGNFTLPFFTRKMGKKRTFIFFNMLSVISLVALFFMPGGSLPLLIAACVVFGFGNAGSSICYAFICDAIEYGDYKYGVRDDGLSFAMMSFGVKCATALTGAVGVPLIFAVGYVADQPQAAATMTGISFVVNILPAILILASIIVMFWYHLDEKKMAVIADRLTARREGKETMEEQLAKGDIK